VKSNIITVGSPSISVPLLPVLTCLIETVDSTEIGKTRAIVTGDGAGNSTPGDVIDGVALTVTDADSDAIADGVTDGVTPNDAETVGEVESETVIISEADGVVLAVGIEDSDIIGVIVDDKVGVIETVLAAELIDILGVLSADKEGVGVALIT